MVGSKDNIFDYYKCLGPFKRVIMKVFMPVQKSNYTCIYVCSKSKCTSI